MFPVATVTLVDLGVDLEEFVATMGTSIGVVILAALTLAAAVFVVKLGWRTIKRYAGG